MDRMTPLDALFLEAEDEEAGVSMAISSIAVFEGPAPATEEFATLLQGRLPLIPRYRQKARQLPFDLGPPVWFDDEHFDLDYHLRRTALPAPGGDEELSALTARIMAARLDRDRPLWEYWLVEGLRHGRWALISKLHHCMVDGVSGTDLYGVVLDPTPDPQPPIADDWSPQPEPTTPALTAAAVGQLLLTPIRQLRLVASGLRHPRTLARSSWSVGRGLLALSEAIRPVSRSSLGGSLAIGRRFAFGRADVAEVRAIRHALGGTFNDVVLTAVTGGFRELLLSRGETPNRLSVRALVPVNIRAPGEESIRDNRVSLMYARLPVHIEDPVERLAAVRAQLDNLKSAHEVDSVALLTELAKHEPFPLLAPVYRFAARFPQRSVITVVTNVPGPRQPLYALGRRLVEIIPYVPIGSTARIGVSILSYCDSVAFGVTGDFAEADLDVLVDGVRKSLTKLAGAASAV
ncbi:WS/DGAT/MGAT family O-acyltransferase [Kribbella sindirgiensis]|uniref:Diacylglycerol O-acyltransferase n=1 Tax=Kribbella sindirgiensis TaxID=1124744 RepID=A0A4V2M3I7_9ACTN|nr:wax ester/triacylglycerol synthase family O-acyltransferase [Kribbella sindirgiensis]TCC32242.1 wax ester/triacylglycerol synthase family O-acyltransferase [Kribbella sindirgiensis]